MIASGKREPLGRHLTGFAAGPADGTYRTRTVTTTLDLLWEKRQEYGVSRVSDITELDRVGLPVFVAVRPGAHPRNLTVSAGKGINRVGSLVSCLAEAYERHWAEPQHHTFLRSSAGELDQSGKEWLAPPDVGTVQGSAWRESTVLDWLSFRDLGHASGEIFVPAAYAVAPYVAESGERLTASSSDGIAAGNTFEEAALHALMELVERDACSFGVWMHRGWRVFRDSLPSSACALVASLEAADLDVLIYQFESILEIPVIYVTLDDRRATNAMLLCAGAGAHIDGEIAITRALTEAAQSRVCAISGGREDLGPKYLDNRTLGYDKAQSGLREWASNFDESPFRRWGAISSLDGVEQALGDVVSGLVERGFARVLVRELTPNGEPLSVVSAVVPGLECVEGPTSPAGRRFRSAMVQYVGGGRRLQDRTGAR